jgi:predicted extracellular nuclease
MNWFRTSLSPVAGGVLILFAFLLLGQKAQAGAIIITQYYEGTGVNKWIELTNVSGEAVDFAETSFTLGLYSNSSREFWKDGVVANSSLIIASGTLLPGASILYKNPSTSLPSYAAGTSSSVGNFNGDDSVILFSGTSTTIPSNVVDAFALTSNTAQDTSFVRIGGFEGTVVDFDSSLWRQFSLSAVDSALTGTDQRLGFSLAAGVPEPSAVFELAACAGLLIALRRRRGRTY